METEGKQCRRISLGFWGEIHVRCVLMCIYEYSLLTSCESSAEKLTEVRIFGLDFFFFVSDLYDIGIRVVGTSRSQYKCVHETERSRICAFLGSFGVNFGWTSLNFPPIVTNGWFLCQENFTSWGTVILLSIGFGTMILQAGLLTFVVSIKQWSEIRRIWAISPILTDSIRCWLSQLWSFFLEHSTRLR